MNPDRIKSNQLFIIPRKDITLPIVSQKFFHKILSNPPDRLTNQQKSHTVCKLHHILSIFFHFKCEMC